MDSIAEDNDVHLGSWSNSDILRMASRTRNICKDPGVAVDRSHSHIQFELGVSKISKGLLEVVQVERKLQKCHTSPKPKKVFELSELRRSSRERKPGISYTEEFGDEEHVPYRKRRSTNINAERAYTGRIASYQQIVAAVKRAEKLEKDLKSPHPTFVKPMVRSHVSSCFWLGLPSKFCKDNLPPCEVKMVLEDEKGEEYDVIYIGNRSGLSGGWRGFALDHNLEDGDALVFELSEKKRFKVYIIKAIREESSETNENETTENTDAVTTPESIMQEKNEKAGSKMQAKKNWIQKAATKRIKA